jgi:hypothetical protein
MVCIYQSDKYTAIYNGRPPRLTRHYCRLQVPLDLSDAQLMLDGEDLANAIANLDKQGFSRTGAIQRCTFQRLFVSDALITEEILEISLGALELSTDEILRRVDSIEKKAAERWDSLPEFLKLDDRPFFDARRPPIELLYLASIRMDVHFHHFLLQRTLIKKVPGSGSEKLLAISREMLGFALRMINNKEIFRDFQWVSCVVQTTSWISLTFTFLGFRGAT